MEDDIDSKAPRFRDIHQGSLSGRDLGRILALTDGVFAFAITLLVIQLIIPVCPPDSTCNEGWLAGRLNHEGTIFLAYVFTFFMIGLWWTRHHAMFRYVERYDATLIWFNLTFLLTIAVQPFILGVFAAYSSVEIAVVLFGAIQAAAGFLLIGLWRHAAQAKLLTPEATPPVVQFMEMRGLVIALIFLVSAGVAVVSGLAAEILWVAAFAVSIYLRRA